MFKDLCFDNELLSEYLLMSLISSPYVRSNEYTLGHIPLNIRNCL